MSKFILKPIFRIYTSFRHLLLLLNNLDNHVLQVSCVDLLKMKFTVSLSELRVDPNFFLLEMNIFLFQLKFSFVESTEAFTKSTDQVNASPVGNNSTSRP